MAELLNENLRDNIDKKTFLLEPNNPQEALLSHFRQDTVSVTEAVLNMLKLSLHV